MDINHLDDEQWGDLLLPLESGRRHLCECAPCRQEHEQLQQAVSTLPAWVRSAEERPEQFWERQQLAIFSRIAQEPERGRRSTRLVWTTALALILLASFVLRTGSRMPVKQTQVDPDQELLVSVEQALNGYVPDALQPASLLADEMSQAGQVYSNSSNSKEKPTHDN